MNRTIKPSDIKWDRSVSEYRARIDAASSAGLEGKIVPRELAKKLLESVIKSGDRVCIEGNNQKHADFLAKTLASLDPAKIKNLHMLQSVVALPEHIEVFTRGIANRLDFAFSGPQAKSLARLVCSGRVKLGAIHTYLELYARYFLDLTPKAALVCAEASDESGNLYTGPNTEDTPVIIEATKSGRGIVIAQVNKISSSLPRVDIPGGWVDFVIPTKTPYRFDSLFTRDPSKISDTHIFMAMLALKGIYSRHRPKRLTHGIGHNTAAIELILPTYGEELGLKGEAATHWALNPHPTLIPAVESGFAERIYSFGSEAGMEKYIEARQDVFPVYPDGTMRSNRLHCQLLGHYGLDMFIGSTFQIDFNGNSSTATVDRIAGFGGAPNMGTNPGGRRHFTEAWGEIGRGSGMTGGDIASGRKIVVQMLETSRLRKSNFVETLDAHKLAEAAGLPIPPVMIYGRDLTHIVTEKGVAYLYKAALPQEKTLAIKAVSTGELTNLQLKSLREDGIVALPEDLGVDRKRAGRELLAARSMKELVEWSGGLYSPPGIFEKYRKILHR